MLKSNGGLPQAGTDTQPRRAFSGAAYFCSTLRAIFYFYILNFDDFWEHKEGIEG
jgi:hypothetical protein